VLAFGEMPQTRHVRGSNMTFIGVTRDRVAGRAIICSALDNLVKGAAGQAVQIANLMLGLPEAAGLTTNGVAP
jgi:N-acetyl-gamma-glutamyl-phosphate reductase